MKTESDRFGRSLDRSEHLLFRRFHRQLTPGRYEDSMFETFLEAVRKEGCEPLLRSVGAFVGKSSFGGEMKLEEVIGDSPHAMFPRVVEAVAFTGTRLPPLGDLLRSEEFPEQRFVVALLGHSAHLWEISRNGTSNLPTVARVLGEVGKKLGLFGTGEWEAGSVHPGGMVGTFDAAVVSGRSVGDALQGVFTRLGRLTGVNFVPLLLRFATPPTQSCRSSPL